MVKGLIYNGKNPETILKWLGSSGEESCEFGSSAMFSPYLSAEDCDCNSKGRYWSIQLDADATDVRRSLPVSQAHAIPGTFTWLCICKGFHPHSLLLVSEDSPMSPLWWWYPGSFEQSLLLPHTQSTWQSHCFQYYSIVTTLQVSCYYTGCAFLQMSAAGKDRWVWLQDQSLKGKWLKRHMLFQNKFCQLYHGWACWRSKAKSISRNKCFLMNPCFQWT